MRYTLDTDTVLLHAEATRHSANTMMGNSTADGEHPSVLRDEYVAGNLADIATQIKKLTALIALAELHAEAHLDDEGERMRALMEVTLANRLLTALESLQREYAAEWRRRTERPYTSDTEK